MKMAAFARFCFMPRSGKYNYLVLREGGGWNPRGKTSNSNSNILPNSILASGPNVGVF